MTTAAPTTVELSMDEIEALLEKASREPLSEEERETFRDLAVSYLTLLGELKDQSSTIAKLRRLVFGATTESQRQLLGRRAADAAASPEAPEAGAAATTRTATAKPPRKKKGHGRIAAEEYRGAERVEVPHAALSAGQRCPHCPGKLHAKVPRRLVRIKGCAPLAATLYEQERLRCNGCGEVFTAEAPEGVGEAKLDETAASMVGLLRYGEGMPMNRIAGLQQALGVPLPASTQWELVRDAAVKVEPVHDELVRQAAQGSVVYNDDTPMRILEVMAERKARAEKGETVKRTGTFTSGIVSELADGHRAVLYFTGVQHAGENLGQVLAHRAAELAPPVPTCDALDRNVPADMPTVLSNCLVHARRQHVEVMENFPEEVKHVVEELALVYAHEAEAKTRGLSPAERLRLHQEKSGPVMKRLKAWMEGLLDEKTVEPNSGLGRAIAYCTKRWERLTLFLRVAGAPLDNNVTERVLKKAILHRKGSLFYKTSNGARVGDMYMSLIASAKLASANPFDYLTELQRHAKDVATTPSAWMPWNYRQAVERITSAN